MKSALLKSLCALILFGSASFAVAVVETYEFDNDAQRDRYQHFIEVLRCPKCQNQNLSGSNSPIAEDLRRELVRLLKEGKQDQEIVDFMVARYGEFVLYEPTFKKNTAFLWLAPLLLLLIGLITIIYISRHQRRIAETNLEETHVKTAEVAVNVDHALPAAVSSKASKIALITFAAAAVFICLGSWLLYRQLGAGEQLQITKISEQFYTEINKAVADNRQPDLSAGRELVKLLVPYLQKHPDDLNLVYVLGSTYAQLSEFDNALPWYKQYLMAVPTDERVLTEYVQLLYITANRQLSERLLFVVDRALTLNPHNLDVLTLMAMHYQQAGEFSKALGYWQQILATLPPDSPSYALVQKAYNAARRGKK